MPVPNLPLPRGLVAIVDVLAALGRLLEDQKTTLPIATLAEELTVEGVVL